MKRDPEELKAILGSHTTERDGSGGSMTDTTTGRGTGTGITTESPGTGGHTTGMTDEAMRGTQDHERNTTE